MDTESESPDTAAMALAAAARLASPPSRAFERIRQLRADPGSRQVIPLVVDYLATVHNDPEAAGALLLDIAFTDCGALEPADHACLLLASDCLRQVPSLPAAAVDEVLTALAKATDRQLTRDLVASFEATAAKLSRHRPGAALVAALAHLAERPNSVTRWWSARLLGSAAATSEQARSICRVLLADDDPWVAANAAFGLARAGCRERAVLAALASGADDYSTSLLGDLGAAIAGDEALGAAIGSLLDDAEADVRRYAAVALVKLGRIDERLMQALVALLDDESMENRFYAVRALSLLGPVDDRVAAALAGRLTDAHWLVRVHSAEALTQLGHADDRAWQALVAALTVDDGHTAGSAGGVFERLARVPDSAAEALVGLLGHADAMVRFHAAAALVRAGRGDERVGSALVDLLRDAGTRLRRPPVTAVLSSLGAISDGLARELRELLAVDDEDLRFAVCDVLVRLGRGDSDVLVLLQEILDDASSPLRACAANVIDMMARADGRPALAQASLLTSSCPTWRLHAAEHLVRAGHADERALAVLREALSEARAFERWRAATVLAEQTVVDEQVIQALWSVLPETYTVQVARTLWRLGRLDAQPLVDAARRIKPDAVAAFAAIEHVAAGDEPAAEEVVALADLLADDGGDQASRELLEWWLNRRAGRPQ